MIRNGLVILFLLVLSTNARSEVFFSENHGKTTLGGDMALMIILDISSSMWGSLKASQKALESSIRNYPASQPAGYIAMGGCSKKRVRWGAHLNPNNRDEILAGSKKFTSRPMKYQTMAGGENIEVALDMVMAELASKPHIQCMKLLILSDFEFTCGGFGRSGRISSRVNEFMSKNINCNQIHTISLFGTSHWGEMLSQLGNGKSVPVYKKGIRSPAKAFEKAIRDAINEISDKPSPDGKNKGPKKK